MVIWDALRGGASGPGLDTMIGHVSEMLGHARHVFDEAMSALLAGASPEALADDVFGTDRRINELEREVRRELIVHISVHGTTDISALLVVLMVSRKVERIGDNAKNIYDLATYDVDLSEADDAEQLRAARDEVSGMMQAANEIFRTEDVERGQAFLERARELQRIYDDLVADLVRHPGSAQHAVPRALLYRYLKRIVANLEGVVAGVVQPLDLIDYSPDGIEESET
jgi:phosphate transport system protein